jgi:hypothetical protein
VQSIDSILGSAEMAEWTAEEIEKLEEGIDSFFNLFFV